MKDNIMKKMLLAVFAVMIAGAVLAVPPHVKKYTKAKAAPVAQVDTNTTTTVTLYTPEGVGQLLVGGAGVGTNAVWVAVGATTNDWVLIVAE